MKILVINAGSSSLKYQLFDMADEAVIAKGLCERITLKGGRLIHKANGKEFILNQDMPTHKEALELVLAALVDKDHGAITNISEINAVGHRILHSGEDFKNSVLVDDQVVRICKKNIDLGPLHMPGEIACVESCRKVLPDVPECLVFDTTFHSTMPPKAYLYGIPYEDYQNYKIRKYGFHGTSHKYIAGETIKWLNKEHSKIIICHLGNGSSLSAIKDGICVDTTMGFTPLEGVMMGTRSGDIDPAAVEYLAEKRGMTLSETVQYLNKKSGMLGVSGIDSDCRKLTEEYDKGNSRAILALEMTAYRIKKYVGAFAAVLGGVDTIVFTGGIGEHSELIREMVMDNMEFLGVDFDKELNLNPPKTDFAVISKPDSKVKILIVPTNEELVIARETELLSQKK